jgi:hypothetical protein
MVLSSLPQRSWWGSGWWMCTWKTKRRQTPPTMQRYIAASVQRRDSNISTNWGMVDDGAGVLVSVFFEASSGGCRRRRRIRLLDEWAKQRRRGASGGVAKKQAGGTRVAALSSSRFGETWQWQHRGRVSLFIPQRKRNGHPNRLR